MAATVRVRNVGPFPRDIRPTGPSGAVFAVVECGAEVEVPSVLAQSLLEQVDVWQVVQPSAVKTVKEG
jgi:hypothetical protein